MAALGAEAPEGGSNLNWKASSRRANPVLNAIQPARGIGIAPIRAIFCAALLLFVLANQALAQFLPTRHLHEEVVSAKAALVKLMPADQSLHLDIILPLRNLSELNNLTQELYDPQSPAYHHFLSVDEFTERFGPTPQDYAGVIQFLAQNGMTVTDISPNRMIVNVAASVANIERAFQVRMGLYRHPTEQRTFYSPDREPSPAGLGVPLWHIAGLDNFSIPHPASLKRALEATGHTTGSGPGGAFLGSDIRAAYYGGALTGTGQSVGLIEFGGYNIADVKNYFAEVGQTSTVPVNGISTDGSSLNCTGSCNDTEQVLDIEEAISMAPGLSQVRVYVAEISDVTAFNRMATDNISKSLSCSWGWSPADSASDNPIFLEFALQGQTLFVASGDAGAYAIGSKDVYPADNALVVSVGGTVLTTAGAGGPWQSETAWVDSGGGPSPNGFAIPKYQTTAGVITAANLGSKTLRNSPDVAAEGNTDNFICYNGTCEGGWGGTSFAAPRWAAFFALLNQQSVASGNGNLGFINITLYAIGVSSNYSAYFHDITSGRNGKYPAETGYDLVTGWGSPNGSALINAIQ